MLTLPPLNVTMRVTSSGVFLESKFLKAYILYSNTSSVCYNIIVSYFTILKKHNNALLSILANYPLKCVLAGTRDPSLHLLKYCQHSHRFSLNTQAPSAYRAPGFHP